MSVNSLKPFVLLSDSPERLSQFWWLWPAILIWKKKKICYSLPFDDILYPSKISRKSRNCRLDLLFRLLKLSVSFSMHLVVQQCGIQWPWPWRWRWPQIPPSHAESDHAQLSAAGFRRSRAALPTLQPTTGSRPGLQTGRQNHSTNWTVFVRCPEIALHLSWQITTCKEPGF